MASNQTAAVVLGVYYFHGVRVYHPPFYLAIFIYCLKRFPVIPKNAYPRLYHIT